jgi:hypothetical protein
VTRLDTFAQVIRHFGEFGASGHCLINLLYTTLGTHFTTPNTLNNVFSLYSTCNFFTYENNTTKTHQFLQNLDLNCRPSYLLWDCKGVVQIDVIADGRFQKQLQVTRQVIIEVLYIAS